MHHPTDRMTHTTAFVTPVVEHWLPNTASLKNIPFLIVSLFLIFIIIIIIIIIIFFFFGGGVVICLFVCLV